MNVESYRNLSDSQLIDQNLQRLAENPTYQNSVLLEMLQKQRFLPRYCAWLDIDGTLSYIKPSGPITEETVAKYERAKNANTKLATTAQELNIPLIGITGRNFDKVLSGFDPDLENLPRFSLIASSFGSEWYVQQTNGEYVLDQEYDSSIKAKTGYDRNAVYRVCAPFVEDMQAIYGQNIGFRTQDLQTNENETQIDIDSPYKIAIKIRDSWETGLMMLKQLKDRLKEAGLEGIQTILSQSSPIDDPELRLSIDVTASTKEMAIEEMSQRFQCGGIVVDDSNGGLQAILHAGSMGMVVGNAMPEIQRVLAPYIDMRRNGFIILPEKNELQAPHRLLFVGDKEEVAAETLINHIHELLLLQAIIKGKYQLPD